MPGGFIPPVVVTITGDISNLRAKIKAAQALLEDFAKNQYNANLGAEVNQSQIQAQVNQAQALVSPWEKDKTANLTAEAATAKITSAVNAAEQFVTPWQMDKTAELTAEAATADITKAVSQAETIVTPWQTDKTANLTAEARAARITEAISAAETLVAPWDKEHDTELGAKVNQEEITSAISEGETLVKPWEKAKEAELKAQADKKQIEATIAYAETLLKGLQAKIAVNADANTSQIKTAITNAQAQIAKAKADLQVGADANVESVRGAILALQTAAKNANIEIPTTATGAWATGFTGALKAAFTTGLGALMGRPTFWGFARTGLAAELAGAGPFHIALTAAGLVGTVGEGITGGAMLTGTGVTVGIIGELTQLTGTGGAANKIRQILQLEKQMQTELATPGEAGQAKITANQIKGLYNQIPPAARGAINSAVGQILQFENLYQSATAKAQAEGATLIAQLTQTAKSYLGVIGNFAAKDIDIILKSKSFQSFRKWMDSTANNKQLEAASKALSKAQLAYNAAEKAYAKGHGSAKAVKEAAAQLQAAQDQMNKAAKKAGGLAIFTELENIFTSHLSTNIQTFVTLLQKIFTTIAELAPRTGGGMQMLQHLVSMNWEPHIQNALTDWQDLKNAISGIWDAIKNFAKNDKTHIGRSILQDLANLADGFANWEKTTAGIKDTNAILQVHKAMLQGLVGVITSMVTALAGTGAAKGGTSAIVAVQSAITGVLHAISALFQIKFTMGKTPVLGLLLTDLQKFFSGLGTIVKEVPGIGPALAGLLKDLSGFFKGMAGLSVGETAAGLTALLLLFKKTGLTTKVLQVIMKPVGMLATKIASGVITLASKITGLNIPNPFGPKTTLVDAISLNTKALEENTAALTGKTPGGVVGKGERGVSTAEGEGTALGGAAGSIRGIATSAAGIAKSALTMAIYTGAIVAGVQLISDYTNEIANQIKAPGGWAAKNYLKSLHPGSSTAAVTRAIVLQLRHDTGDTFTPLKVEGAFTAIMEHLQAQGLSEPAVAKALKPLMPSLEQTLGPEAIYRIMSQSGLGVTWTTFEHQLGLGPSGRPTTPMVRTATNKTISAAKNIGSYLQSIESVLAGHGTPKNLGNLVTRYQEQQLFSLRKLQTGSTQQEEQALGMLGTLAKNPAVGSSAATIGQLIQKLMQEIAKATPKTKAAAEQSAKTTGQGYAEAFNEAMKETKGKITATSLETLHIDPKTAQALIAAYKATGKQGVEAFAQAISKEEHKPANAIVNVINTMIDQAHKELKMSSPSKVFVEMGEGSMEGLVKGFSEPVYLDHIKASLNKVKGTNATFFAAMDKNMEQWGAQLMTELAQGITLNMGAVSQALTHSLQTAMQTAVTSSSKTATHTLVSALKQGVF